LKNRYDCFIKALDLRKVCLKCLEYEEYEDLMQDDDRFKYIHDMILMKNEIGSMYMANRVSNNIIKEDYLSLIRYIHGYQAYNDKTRKALRNLTLDKRIYSEILYSMVQKDAYNKIEASLNNLKGYL
ncbi:MAG: hypothetical protein KJ971_00055, partial [Firmicutes bacterium]|nr:hypothetical protein [Bacillota bacterium]